MAVLELWRLLLNCVLLAVLLRHLPLQRTMEERERRLIASERWEGRYSKASVLGFGTATGGL